MKRSRARALWVTAALAATGACGSRTALLAGTSSREGDGGGVDTGGGIEAGDGTMGGDAGDGGTIAPCVGTIPFKETGPDFLCGTSAKGLMCWGGTQYCYEGAGGPPPGVGFAKCEPLPCGCENDLGCGCVDASASQACFCRESGGQITVMCSFP